MNIRRLLTFLFLGLIKTYQFVISPILGPTCRFYPSCSEYAYQAIARHGPARGSYYAVKRLLRCHPFQHGGVDPVP